MIPGVAIGVTDEALNAPALPNDAPSPGVLGSTRKDTKPVALQIVPRRTATTMPAPINLTRFVLPVAIPCSAPFARSMAFSPAASNPVESNRRRG